MRIPDLFEVNGCATDRAEQVGPSDHGCFSYQGAAWGAYFSDALIGRAKAVTATARKIAVLICNALRHGMSCLDSGATYYEDRYRQRVLQGLRGRAESLAYVLQEGSLNDVGAS
jgi:hypothetical protein